MLELGLIIQTMLWLGIFMLFLKRRDASIFHPVTMYLVFHGLVFVIRPWLVTVFEFELVWSYMRFTPTEPQLLFTLALSSVGLLVFYVSATHFGRATLYPPGGRLALTSVEKQAFFITFLLLTPLAAISIYQTLLGIEGEHVGATYILKNTSGYIVDAQQMLVPLSFMVILLFRRWWAYLPLAMFLSFRVYYGWARWTIVLTLLMLLLGQVWMMRKRWPRFRYLLALPLIWLVFTSLGFDRALVKRYVEGQSTFEKVVAGTRASASSLDSPDFANFDYLTFVHDVVPDKTGTYTYGTQYLQLFTEPIPRVLWKNKPVGAPITFFDLNDYGNFLGLTVSIVGDGWISGGWAGVVVTLFLLGLLLGKFHRWFWRNQGNFTNVFMYLVILAETLQQFRDGGISIFKFVLFTTLPILVWKLTIHGLKRMRVSKAVRTAGPRVSQTP